MAAESVGQALELGGAPSALPHLAGPAVGSGLYRRFALVLMLTHACNMRCGYCYAGGKSGQAMPEHVGRKGVDRALASLEEGGELELGFFGGEPLLEAPLMAGLLQYASDRCSAEGNLLLASVTTNGTIADSTAWSLMERPDLRLFVSHDGLPEVHNRHRRSADGCGTSARVLATIRRLVAAGKEFGVVMVVRPDTVELLPAGIQFLWGLGVRRIDPTLDLWTEWTRQDASRLDAAIARCAEIWRARLPGFAMSWFDEKAALLAHAALTPTARCGFGDGQIAVSPAGGLYPCERLIGENGGASPVRLPGNVLEGEDFLCSGTRSCRPAEGCAACAVRSFCTATCPCSNHVRSGDPGRPDGLICLLNRSCIRETARVMDVLPEGLII